MFFISQSSISRLKTRVFQSYLTHALTNSLSENPDTNQMLSVHCEHPQAFLQPHRLGPRDQPPPRHINLLSRDREFCSQGDQLVSQKGPRSLPGLLRLLAPPRSPADSRHPPLRARFPAGKRRRPPLLTPPPQTGLLTQAHQRIENRQPAAPTPLRHRAVPRGVALRAAAARREPLSPEPRLTGPAPLAGPGRADNPHRAGAAPHAPRGVRGGSGRGERRDRNRARGPGGRPAASEARLAGAGRGAAGRPIPFAHGSAPSPRGGCRSGRRTWALGRVL